MIQYHKENILAHLVDENSLTSNVSSYEGCINVASYSGASLKVCYIVSGNAIILEAILITPIGECVIGKATLDTRKPTVTFGGSFHGFVAEATMSFDFSTYELELFGNICAPQVGCKSGSVSVRLA